MAIMPRVHEVSNMLDAALSYAEAGIHVFPVKPGAKRPLGGRGQDDATTNPDVVRAMFLHEANLGIACEPSGLFVVDIDVKPEGVKPDGTVIPEKFGDTSWAILTAAVDREGWFQVDTLHGPLEVPPTYAVRTWSGGVQLYFAQDGDFLKNSAGKLGKDIDTRGNGYVVAPPSQVSDAAYPSLPGATYTVLSDAPLLGVPQFVRDAYAPPVTSQAPAKGTSDPASFPIASEEEVLARIDSLCKELASAPHGTRNDTLSRTAFMVGQYVGADQVSSDDAASALLAAVDGWDDPEKTVGTLIRQLEAGVAAPRPWRHQIPKNSDSASSSVATGVPGVSGELPVDPHTNRVCQGWFTDAKMATWVAESYLRGRFLFSVSLGWLKWDGKRWAECESDDLVIGAVMEWMQEMYRRALEKELNAPLGGDQTDNNVPLHEMWRKMLSRSKIESVARLARTQGCLRVDVQALDGDPELLNTTTGVVNLRTGELMKHHPKFLMTKITKGGYRQGFTHPDWEKARQSLSGEVKEYLALRLGQAATGYAPESHDCLFLKGPGSNGKSLYTTDGVVEAMGDYAIEAQQSLVLKASDSGATPEKASLRGARLVVVEELPEKTLSTSSVKAILGTNSIAARHLYRETMNFAATHTLIITTNNELMVDSVDKGTFDRFTIVPFTTRFTANPKPGEMKADAGLPTRIRRGLDGQLDAIVTWMVESAMRYLALPEPLGRDHTKPREMEEAKQAVRMRADLVLAYITDRLVFEPGAMVAKSDLYADFTEWSTGSGHRRWAMETFFTKFSTHSDVKDRVANGQTKNVAGVSRPHGWTPTTFGVDVPALPARPRVVTGIRFRTDEDAD
jgi:P4 family phage/plasmid primase-like protien